jgi:hypothetical protein
MAMGDEWTEWHLTPRGWERGSERQDAYGTKTKPPPTDTVLTVRYYDYLRGGSQLEEKWRSQDGAEVARLLKEHGEAPRNL